MKPPGNDKAGQEDEREHKNRIAITAQLIHEGADEKHDGCRKQPSDIETEPRGRGADMGREQLRDEYR